MPSFKALTFAMAAAALAASVVDNWNRSAADVRTAGAAVASHHAARPASGPDAAYLPDLFVDEERAAPIEPLPPQF